MNQFLIEFRLRDEAKEFSRAIIFETARKFKLPGDTNFKGYKGHPRNRALPPHTVLYGAAATNDIKRVADIIERVSDKCALIPFKINREIINLHNKAICLTIAPSKQLEALRWELATELNKFCRPKPYDLERNFIFHVTIANVHDSLIIKRIMNHLRSKNLVTFDLNLNRLTLLEDGEDEIIGEYDLIFHRWLTRDQAISEQLWNETKKKERELEWIRSVSS